MDLITLVREREARAGAEIGVWRGATSFRLLTECPLLEKLYLVDPWLMSRIHFVVPLSQILPPRMPKGFYSNTMGEENITQTGLEDMYQAVLHRVAEEFPTRAIILRRPSTRAAWYVAPMSLDFVYIDAIHLYPEVMADLFAWAPKLKAGGLLTGDDWGSEFPGVERAVREFADLYEITPHQESGGFWWMPIKA